MDKRVILRLFYLCIFAGFFSTQIALSNQTQRSHSTYKKYFIRCDSLTTLKLVELGYFPKQHILYSFRYIPWIAVQLTKDQERLLRYKFPSIRLEEIGPLKLVRAVNVQTPVVNNDFSHLAFQITGITDASNKLQLSGNGIRIAVMDDGFHIHHPSLKDIRIVAMRNFTNDTTFESFSSHGTEILSLLGGTSPQRKIGFLNHAEYYLAKVFRSDQEDYNDELSWCRGLEWSIDMGVQIVNNSFVFPNRTATSLDSSHTYELLKEMQSRGIYVVCAAGNEGPFYYSISSPASYRNVIAVGATDPMGLSVDFSSKGETLDGWFKPDFCAQGTYLLSATGYKEFRLVSGTSYATPIIVTAFAMVMERNSHWDYGSVFSALKASSDDYLSPNRERGYGIPNVMKAIDFPSITIQIADPHIQYVGLQKVKNFELINRLFVGKNQSLVFRNVPFGFYWIVAQPKYGPLKIIPIVVSDHNLTLQFTDQSSAPNDNK